jgi:hypothetical protein
MREVCCFCLKEHKSGIHVPKDKNDRSVKCNHTTRTSPYPQIGAAKRNQWVQPKSSVMLNRQFEGAHPIDVFVVLLGRWSDGSTAPVM